MINAEEAKKIADEYIKAQNVGLGEIQFKTIILAIETYAKEGGYNYTVESQACNSYAQKRLKELGFTLTESRQPYEENYVIINW